jgi:predicted amidohydrolase
MRIALANLRYPDGPEQSLELALEAIAAAGAAGASIVCFPECYVPGYRWPGVPRPAPDAAFQERAFSATAAAARAASVAVVLGTERFVDGKLRLSALVAGPDGAVLGFQDKVQLDPSEGDLYSPGEARQVFRVGELCFGVVICHEGFRYPETVRWAARHGAQIVFHPHYDAANPSAPAERPFGDPSNTFHEKSMLCRAAENTCYFASVNCAGVGSTTTSAVVDPQGVLVAHQPRGKEGLLLVDVDLKLATGFLAGRLRPEALEP